MARARKGKKRGKQQQKQQQSDQGNEQLISLPTPALLHILGFLDLCALDSLSQVSHDWRNLLLSRGGERGPKMLWTNLFLNWRQSLLARGFVDMAEHVERVSSSGDGDGKSSLRHGEHLAELFGGASLDPDNNNNNPSKSPWPEEDIEDVFCCARHAVFALAAAVERRESGGDSAETVAAGRVEVGDIVMLKGQAVRITRVVRPRPGVH
jgi:F-box-like